jgi:uncharacterized integral membrane protein (TIGR00698 family)
VLSNLVRAQTGRLHGLLSCAVVAFAALFLAQNYGAPVMLFALLLGMSANFLYEDGRCIPGIDFAASTVLRVGVALLGARVLVSDFVELGWSTAALVVAGVVMTILAGVAMARLLGLDRRLGMLSGGAVAICGISAAMTLSAVMPRDRETEQYTLLTVVTVAAFGAVAMVSYPVLAQWLGLDVDDAGLFLGASIHDVSHVVGASFNISPEVGYAAMIVKMLRVALLVPVAWVFLWVFRNHQDAREQGAPAPLPLFLVAFFVLVLVNNLGLIPESVALQLDHLSRACFVLAIVALGMKTSFKGLLAVGWRPLALVLFESLFLGALVLAWVLVL